MSFNQIEFDASNFNVIAVYLAENPDSEIFFENRCEVSTSPINNICRKRKTKEKDILTLGMENEEKRNFTFLGKNFNFRVDVKKYIKEISTYVPFLNLILQYEDKEALEELIKKSKEYYKNYVHDEFKKDGMLNIWFNDGEYFYEKTQVPKRNSDTIYLSEGKKEKVINTLETFLKSEDLYKKLGISHRIRILLHGPPGTGKTSFIHYIASKLDMNICSVMKDLKISDVKFNSLLSNVKENCITVFEDMDFLVNLKSRESRGNLSLGTILNCLDGLTSTAKICIITMNDIKGLDPAFIRPGRIDHIFEIGYTDIEQVNEMYKVYMMENYDSEKNKEFIKSYKKLKINSMTPSILQNFFFKYIKDPDLALENIEEIKKIKEMREPSREKNMYL